MLRQFDKQINLQARLYKQRFKKLCSLEFDMFSDNIKVYSNIFKRLLFSKRSHHNNQAIFETLLS